MIDINVKKLYYFGKEEDWLLFMLKSLEIKMILLDDPDNTEALSKEYEQIKIRLKTLLPDLDPESDDVRLSRVWDVRRYKLKGIKWI